MIPNHRKSFTVILLAGLMLCGCQGSRSLVEIRVPLEQQYVLEGHSERPITLSLPGDQPFNIHIRQSSQNPGSDGQAQGSSDVNSDGQAFCTAESSNGGSAMADFTIGHRLANQTDNPQTMVVELDCQLLQSIQASPTPKPDTLACADLQMLVVDTKGKTLATVQILKTNSDQAVASADLRDHRSLSVYLEPRISYDVVLAGRVEANSAAGQNSLARLEVKGLEINLSFTSEQKEATKAKP